LKHKKVVIAGIALFVLMMLGGGLFMNKNSGDWSERHREDIEENVRNYVERYKLDPDKVEIKRIMEPITFPTGEEEFRVKIYYHGEPFFSYVLVGDPNTLHINSDNNITVSIFNELYLEERYEEFKPAIEYLKSIGIKDSLRPEEAKIQYFNTSLGFSNEINDELENVFRESNYDMNYFQKYIQEEIGRLRRLGAEFSIIGTKEGIDDILANEMREELISLLPPANYHAQIGVRDPATGVGVEGLYDYFTVLGGEND
jgi:hypothetical protein